MASFLIKKSPVPSPQSPVKAFTGNWKLVTGNLFIFLSVFCLLFSVICPLTYANNISVLNGVTTDQNTVSDTMLIQFDLSWDNSWRDTVNYDAAWVFVKYSVDSGTTWNHAYLSTTAEDHTIPSGYECGVGVTDISGSKGMGIFIQRSTVASGTATVSNVKLLWKYGENSVTDVQAAQAFVRVMAIEMVYIPQGSFYIGSGGTGTSECYKYPTTTNTYLVSSEAAINVGTTTDYLYYPTSTYGGDQTGPILADFPKGYNDFYIMKYEISQTQYADFLNTLTSTQASNRYPNSNGNYRHTISGTYPNYSASRPDRACNYLKWADVAAYTDWAGLRPFTELEFEKACRGTAAAVADEYAWGSTSITAAATISGTEDGTEAITTANANCCYGMDDTLYFSGGDEGEGPLRCGIFFKSATTREQAGASYYGAADLSGNVWERAVTIGNSTGRAFTGLHGDGALDTNGNANATNWPGTDGVGGGVRGGTWYHEASYARVCDRYYGAYPNAARNMIGGGRCARTAP